MKLTRDAFCDLRNEAQRALRRSKETPSVLICAGTGCIAGGAMKIYENLRAECESRNLPVYIGLKHDTDEEKSLHVKMSGCHGFCEMGPLVHIEPMGIMYIHVKPEDCHEILEKTVLGGEIIDRLVYRLNGVAYPRQEDIPFYKKQHRVVLENCGTSDAEDIEEYIAKGGYSGFEQALFEMTDEADLSGHHRLRPPGPGRRRLPRRPEVGRRPPAEGRQEVHRLQRRRGRPRRLHGPLHHGGQPPLRAGGHDDRGPGRRQRRGLYLRPGRVSPGRVPAESRHRQGGGAGPAGRRHPGQRLLLPPPCEPRRRRLRLRRGQRPDRLHRGQPGHAPGQAAPHH